MFAWIDAEKADMQAEINVVWDKLLPAFHAGPLPEWTQW